MYGFELKAFDPIHLVNSELRQHEQDLLSNLPGWETKFSVLSEVGSAWSIFRNGTHISSGGITPFFGHIAEMWQFPSVHVATCQFSYAKFFKKFVDEQIQKSTFTRFQTTSLNDDLHKRWMNFLGFRAEGIMQRYGINGEDYILWARL